MSFADQILGLSSKTSLNEDDLPPGLMSPSASAMLRQRRLRRMGSKVPKPKSELKEDEGIIPSDAELISGKSKKEHDEETSCAKEPQFPSLPNAEGAYPVAVALVAPDCVLDLYKPLSPSEIPPGKPAATPAPKKPAEQAPHEEPKSDDALDVILNKAPASPSALPVNVESFMRALAADVPAPLVEGSGAGAVLPTMGEAILRSGQPMPEHKPSSQDTVSTFRNFL